MMKNMMKITKWTMHRLPIISNVDVVPNMGNMSENVYDTYNKFYENDFNRLKRFVT